MSRVETASKWLENTSDWANAILVKEVRQSLKSRQFVLVFMLLLIVSWFASAFVLLTEADALEYGVPGRTFFFIFFTVLCVAVLAIVPMGTFGSIYVERDQNTYELLNITTLSPRQIVWGKLLSALVKVFILYSAIMPFIAFASLLQGFDVAWAAYSLVMAGLGSLFLSMTALTLGTFVRQRGTLALMVIPVLIILMTGGQIVEPAVRFFEGSFNTSDFWWVNGFLLVAGISYFFLFQQIAVAQLTFDSGNRSTGIRIICAAQFWMLWIGYIIFKWYSGHPIIEDELISLSIMSVVHWTLVGLFAVTEKDNLSRRLRRDVPNNRVKKFLLIPFMPGGGRGFLYLLMHLGVLCLFVTVLTHLSSAGLVFGSLSTTAGAVGGGRPGLYYRPASFETFAVPYAIFSSAYVVIYLGLGAALGRFMRTYSRETRPSHVRILTVMLMALGTVLPLLPRMIDPARWRSYSLIEISNPFQTISTFISGRASLFPIMILLGVGVLISLVLNRQAVRDGFGEVMSGDYAKKKIPAPDP